MNFPYQVNLAISLHAPTDELRRQIMPVANAYPLKDLMQTIREYIAKTNRRVTFSTSYYKELTIQRMCGKLSKTSERYELLHQFNSV